MKTAVISPIRIEPELLAELEAVLKQSEIQQLAVTPFSFRKAAQNPAQRKLTTPFGRTGYVVLYEIVSASKVVVLAARH
jgi:hypothetical protein